MIKASPRKPSSSRILIETRILSSAERAFSEKGFSGTSMESVAELAGISKQNLIYYFDNKELLYRRVLQDILDLWIEKMTLIEDQDASPSDVISVYIREKLRLSQNHPHGSKVFAHEIINGAPVLKDYLISHLKPQFERDVALVSKWVEAGLIDPIDPEHLFFTIWAATQTYADFSTQIQLMQGKSVLSEADFDKAEAFLTKFVLQGMGVKK